MTGALIFATLVVVSFFAVLLRARLARLAAMAWTWAAARGSVGRRLPSAKRFELQAPRSVVTGDDEGLVERGLKPMHDVVGDLFERLTGPGRPMVMGSPVGYTGYSNELCECTGYTGYSGGHTGPLRAGFGGKLYEWRQVKCGDWIYVELSTQEAVCEVYCSGTTGLWRVSQSGSFAGERQEGGGGPVRRRQLGWCTFKRVRLLILDWVSLLFILYFLTRMC